jgi:hypothetical protein
MTRADTWPTDPKFRRFAALVADATMHAVSEGSPIDPGEHTPECCCPLGAVCMLVTGWQPRFPTCDDSSAAVAVQLGGKSRDWIDQCRHFEVGFDGDDPKEECVSKRDPYWKLGVAYREAFS